MSTNTEIPTHVSLVDRDFTSVKDLVLI